MDEISITIHIAGRQYRLKSDESEKEHIEEAARRINKAIRLYAENFAYKDNQDLLAMVSLQQTLTTVQCEVAIEAIEEKLGERGIHPEMTVTNDNNA